jgi:ribonuclease J
MTHSFLNNEDELYFVPLGGAEQFGVNLNVYASGGELLAVDCGIGFADESMPGIDIMVPDPAFLVEHGDDLAGMIITHAHEDHVGAVAYLWERLKCPLYATEFTAEILRRKLGDNGLKHVKVQVIYPIETFPGNSVKIGQNFDVQFVPVAHSIPGACALVIDTPQGRILHSGDWNLDPAPVVGQRTEPDLFKAIGDAGVLAYIGDSTNAQSDGYAGSERDVSAGLEEEFKLHKGRIIVTSFSSNIGRIKSIMRAAQANGRAVGVVGRSLHRMIGAASECGYLDGVPEIVPEDEIGDLPHDETVIIVTGSQGEARAALARIARGGHRNVKLNSGDTVIFSARAIPGNEKSINAIKNNLSAAGVTVVSPNSSAHQIHVSGHPCRDEIAEMLAWLRPNTVVPVHGERMQIEAQAEFAKSCQIPHVVIPQNGSVILLGSSANENGVAPKVIDHIETGVLAIDQKRIIASSHPSISQRRKLQFSGTLHVSLVMDEKGNLLGEPKLDSYGLIDTKSNAEIEIEDSLFDAMFDRLEDMTLNERREDEHVEEQIRRVLRRVCNDALGIKPQTTVQVLRV